MLLIVVAVVAYRAVYVGVAVIVSEVVVFHEVCASAYPEENAH